MLSQDHINRLAEKLRPLEAKVVQRDRGFAVLEVDISLVFRRYEHPIRMLVSSYSTIENELSENYEWLDDCFIEFGKSQLFPIALAAPGNKTRARQMIKKTVFVREQPIISADKLLSKGNASELFRDAILSDLSVDLLSPYRIDTCSSDRMFFGRSRELNKLRQLRGNQIIYGSRRIGKSSLVLQLQRELGNIPKIPGTTKAPANPLKRCSYVDVSALGTRASDEILGHIIRGFGLDQHGFYKNFGRKLKLSSVKAGKVSFDEAKALEIFISLFEGQLTIILDEVDGWIERESTSGWVTIDMLRALTDRGKANVILVGYETLQAASGNDRFPLAIRGGHLPLGPLNRNAVKELILVPMSELKIKMDPENEIVERIWQASSGMPHLVQDMCGHLIDMSLSGKTKTAGKAKRLIIDSNTLRTALGLSEAFKAFRKGVMNSDFPLAEAIAGLISIAPYLKGKKNNLDKQDGDETSLSDAEIASELENSGYKYDGAEYDLAISYLELRSIIRPLDANRTTWVWVNRFAREDMAEKILSLEPERWRDGVVRQHCEGSWKHRYRVLGRLK